MRRLFVPAAVLSVFALLFALSFFSCDNMSGGGSDYAPQSAPTQTAPASNPTAPSSGQEIYVVFRGSVGVRGALPKEVSANVAALENSIPAGDGSDLQLVSKSAEPGLNVNGTDYYYYVIATPQDSVGNTTVSFDGKGETGEEADAKFKRGSNGITYELALKIGKWKIECGIKNKGGAPVLRDITDVIELTPTDSVINKSFVATPAPDSGNGSVLLYFDLGDASSTIASAVARYKDSEGTEQSKTLDDATTLDPVGPSGNLALKLDSVAPGAYEMAISFYNATGVMVYQTVQTVNVLGGMKTDTWVSGGGTDAETNLITGDGFIITTAAVNIFKSTYLYVGATGASGAKTPSDSNEGSAMAPFANLQKAIDTIAATGSDSADYKVYVCGTVKGNATLASGLDSKARSISIEGLNQPESGQSPTDAIAGGKIHLGGGAYTLSSVLDVETSVPISIKGIKIIKDSDASTSRGLQINAENAKVTLLGGTEISGHEIGNISAGGVDVVSGTLFIKGAKISGNIAGTDGGGVYVHENAGVEMSSGEISGNTAGGSSGLGAGVYLSANSSFEMTGGSVSGNNAAKAGGGIFISNGAQASFSGGSLSQNTASGSSGTGGGAVYVGASASFKMSGSANIPYGDAKGSNDVYLNATDSDKAMIEVDGVFSYLASAQKAATITPKTWERNVQVLKSSSPLINAASVKFFAISDDDFDIIPSSDNKWGTLTAPIFVAGATGRRVCTKAGSHDAVTGTKNDPFCNVSMAFPMLSGGGKQTIYVDGTVEQSNTLNYIASGVCSELTIKGWSDGEHPAINDDGTPYNKIIGGGPGSHIFNIWITTPIKIENLHITGASNGYNDYGCGGGIRMIDGAKLTLASGALVSGNSAAYKGGGVYLKGSGTKLTMKAGSKVCGNSLTQNYNDGDNSGGAGVYVGDSAEFVLEGGEVSDNTIGDKLGGAGVYVASGATLTMTGGKIAENKIASTAESVSIEGGAVYCAGTFNISGSANIPYGITTKIGSETTTTRGAGYNDVYLPAGKTVTIADDLSLPDGASSNATITLPEFKRKTKFLSAATDDLITDNKDKIALAADDGGWDKDNLEESSKYYAIIDSPIYVVDANDPDDSNKTRPVGFNRGKVAGATGTKKSPYASIAAALGCADLALADNTITVAGTLNATQTTGDSVTASSVTIKGYDTNATINGNAGGSALTIAAAKTFTIQQLNITGGSTSQGGGINITAAATVNLNSGAKIYGNATKTPGSGYGGGVYVCSGATLNINNGSEIYSNTALSGDYCSGGGVFSEGTVNVKTGSKLYKNSAKNGGAIYNLGTLAMSGGTIGGSADDKNTAKYGGGINNASGKEVTISGGELSYNSATDDSGEQVCGGAILNYGKITISDAATISYNTASETNTTSGSAKGGGISNWYGGELIISGAVTMNGNETSASAAGYASQGGAIYNYGTLTMSNGTIGASGALNVVKGQGKQGGAIYQRGTFNISGSATIFPGSQTSNDVYLESEKTITINADYTGSGNNDSSKMFVTPSAWTRGLAILGGAKLTTTNKGYFSIPDTDWSVVTTGSAGALTGYINADIYVSSSGSDSYTGASLSKAFKTIAAAAKVCNSYKNEIKVSGTFNMSQEIPTDVTASSITLTGINSAKIDTTESKDAFTVAKALTLTITDITFKGATTTNKAGINISNSSADVRLGSGVKVEGNYNGISNSGKLCLYGDAIVGKNVDGLPAADNNAGNSFYGIKNNSGQLWIGYTEPAADKADTSFSGGVKKNWNRGIYIGSGTAYISKGAISFNAGGGIDNEGNLTISGGNIDNNKTTNGGGIFNGGTLTISGNATINSNQATSSGGGIYHNSTGLLTISGGEISSNTGSGITVASSSNHYIVMTGGKICKNTGRGIFLNSKSTFVMSGSASIGDSSNNSSGNAGGGLHTSGGNVYLGYTYNNGTISPVSGSMTGGIFYNSASEGGGMYIASGSSVYLAAGTISGNSSTSNGGAIYHVGAGLHIKGSVSLPCTGAKQNDIYLAEESSALKQITVDGSLGGSGAVATITPANYASTTQVVKVSGSVTLAQAAPRFAVNPDGSTEYTINTADGKLKKAALTVADITTAAQIYGPYEEEFQHSGTSMASVNLSTLQGKLIFFRLANNGDCEDCYGVLSFQNLTTSSVGYSFKRFKDGTMDIDVPSGTITFSDYDEFPGESIAIGLSASFDSVEISCDEMANGDVFIDKSGSNFTFSAGMCGNSYESGYPDWAGYYILSQ